ncbi:MAG: sigma 54-dependent Fis family transcriptional regulator [Polyangiaceae bacterium]|nr:sigma 54-dependent Fis family transcriptional regulator [Polyangiaceae bacterium]
MSGHDEQSTLMQVRFAPTAPAKVSFGLLVLEGPNQNEHFLVAHDCPSRTLIGQSMTCAIRVSDRTVSRRHATLDIAGERLRITDLDSRNGTFLNEIAIAEAWAQGGEVLRVGSTKLLIERHPEQRRAPLWPEMQFGKTVGASTEMRRLYPLCQRLAQATVPVIIEGETGTGKEVLAESLHAEGPRSSRPFIVFDCTAVPPNLIESELFGHVRGAFTGAHRDRKGVFELARGGTLLIDEIGDLDLALQAKLLRAIDRGEVRAVGSDRTLATDVRIIAATRRDLDREVHAGRFRDDLLHRLSVARIELPPLRERKGDVRVLAQRFWAELGGEARSLPAAVLMRWEDERWPGNVRELRNAVARHLVLGELEQLHPLDATDPPRTEAEGLPSGPSFDAVVREVVDAGLPLREARERIVFEFEKRFVCEMLRAKQGNVTQAAARAGVARRYFQQLKSKVNE